MVREEGRTVEGRTYRELFQDRDFPILAATPQNIYYTTGFYTTAKRPYQIGYNCGLMTPEKTYFFFPANWKPLVEEQTAGTGVELVPYRGGVAELAEQIAKLSEGAENLGFEAEGMELNLYLALKKAWKGKNSAECWEDVTPCFQRARLVKDAAEIQCLRAAANLAQRAMEHARAVIRPGMTEMELAAELESFMRKNGSEGVPFTMKALTGENAVRTINLPGDNKIQKGSMVLLDFGTVVQHYASDWTRTFAVGSCSDEQRELYSLVWKVERGCIGMIRPGVTYQDLMNRAMEALEGHPYARWFNPYLGHSIGISSQEWPSIVPGAEQTLEKNMVITIEPGIYIPGLGGVRIEDMVLVTETGCEILTGLSDETFVIPV